MSTFGATAGPVLDFIRGLFAEQGVLDDREALLRFEIPGFSGAGIFELYAPSTTPWIILTYCVLIQTFLQCISAVFIYQLIVKYRGSLGAYFLGWGVVIPMAIIFPYPLLEFLKLENLVVKLAVTTLPTVVFFRTIEAMYGTSPPFVEDSLSNYVSYYSSIVPFVWDPKTRSRRSITVSEALQNLSEILVAFTGASLILSLLMHFDFRPFSSDIAYNQLSFSPDLLSFNHIGNAYLHGLLLFGTLKTGFELTAFNENIKGVATHRIFDRPLFGSRSPTDFWTNRWNKMTQTVLRHGVFLPMKRTINPKLAVLFTFVVSGLYHDYVWTAIFYSPKDDEGNCLSEINCYDAQFGRVTLFFIYTGLIMMLERPISCLSLIRRLSTTVPLPIRSHLVFLIHIPVAYWYYGDWIEGGYFDHFSIALWHVKQVAQ